MESWQLAQYEIPARQMCDRLGVDQNEQLMNEHGFSYPRWFEYARRMAEHAVMVQVMRDHGHPV